METITFNNHKIYLKRDDLLHKDFSGNKARKFFYFLKNDFPHIKKLVSHGSAQSNAMYSLSVLCKLKAWTFDYYVDHIASFLKDRPIGNYKEACENGMNIYEKGLPDTFDDDVLFINEGGALDEASFGLELLAVEIKDWIIQNKIQNPKVFLPSGTGTTALYLQKYLPYEVITCACVGDEDYLQKQFELLENENFPTIIKKDKKYHFGKLYKDFYDKYIDLLSQTNIEFDLLYDSLGFICLEKYLYENKNIPMDMIYLHQGGIKGNISMLERYEWKYL
jgi:1-aminocyclopropane-1-carboxylate deaminase/D-cysteine desulfhydrase-like pyridoxal-dependent ACC family enzyme